MLIICKEHPKSIVGKYHNTNIKVWSWISAYYDLNADNYNILFSEVLFSELVYSDSLKKKELIYILKFWSCI